MRELIALVAGHGITEFEWEHKKDRMRIRRGGTDTSTARPAAPVPETAPVTPAPDSTPPVSPPSPAEAVSPPPGPTREQPPPAPPPDKDGTSAPANVEEITSPMVGTFFARARPDAPAFVEKGETVEPGQTLCIVEAMKLMNEIQSEKNCRIVDILVEDGESVEYGQPLILVEPL